MTVPSSFCESLAVAFSTPTSSSLMCPVPFSSGCTSYPPLVKVGAEMVGDVEDIHFTVDRGGIAIVVRSHGGDVDGSLEHGREGAGGLRDAFVAFQSGPRDGDLLT